MQSRLGYYLASTGNLKNSKYKCKKTVVYHLVNGSMVLLRIENSKNDRLKVILGKWPKTGPLGQKLPFLVDDTSA